MFSAKKLLLAIIITVIIALPVLALADGSVTIPSYAAGQNLESKANSVGQKISTFLLIVAGIVGVIGLTWAGILMAIGKGDEGKQKFTYALVGVLVVGSVGGFLKLVV